jgi:hypothetical protein
MFKDYGIKLLGIAAGFGMALVGGAWTMAADADAGRPAAGGAVDSQTLSVSVNVPLNEIQDGQWCQAYGLASGGTGPYSFSWSGEFSHSGSTGPLGPGQIINGNMYAGDPDYLRVDVVDSSSPTPQTGWNQASLNIGDYEYNESCEA